jgi:hypothetical protein
MGTRSLTFIYDTYKARNGRAVHRPIINLYRQYDGYPSGHGAEIVEFLKQFTMTNGIPVGRDNTERRIANGMGCLAAQFVSAFKGSDAGQFYLYPVSAKDCGQDYEYHIYSNGPTFRVKVINKGCNMFGLTQSDTNEVIFDGVLASAEEFCTKEQA